ncbi:MAG: putative toxin-antitoxin system toxin component, PIN family [Kiritimatiellae bacterium]|nr:putative toxin-antitoxin system toxin component, PIN family [Kiritimatiellia bacterium]MDD4024572.1 putative toxin-antitoxin system toxin component, PIN family [Kiritimatiellia bacterium]MDD4622123.1 putative toxin-antitoxin system toxin component, PIN family [Kiritimatiellia bacterium]
MRVSLDTNVIASATAARGLCADLFRTVIEFHQLVVSDHLLEEIKRILGDKFHAPLELVEDLVCLLKQDAVRASVLPLADLRLRDPADIAIVSSAINGNADLLVTGDKEIVGLAQVGRLRIVTPRQFWEIEKGQQNGGGVGIPSPHR